MKILLALAGALVALALVTPGWAAEPLVDAQWVKANLGQPGIVFLDVRGNRNAYRAAHLPGAVHTDYARDGWRITKGGVRGLLPDKRHLEALAGRLGIANDSHLVIAPGGYGASEMAVATRIYWTFKVMGLDEVSILDGGMSAYLADSRNPVEKGDIRPQPATFTADMRLDLLATTEDVRRKPGSTLVDSRPNDQFLGINKSGSVKRRGTLPGALNVPISWLTVNGRGFIREAEEIRDLYRFAGAPTEGDTIYFCNTGHMASLGWFVASEILGNTEARLYDGSMAEWTADPANPVERRIETR